MDVSQKHFPCFGSVFSLRAEDERCVKALQATVIVLSSTCFHMAYEHCTLHSGRAWYRTGSTAIPDPKLVSHPFSFPYLTFFTDKKFFSVQI